MRSEAVCVSSSDTPVVAAPVFNRNCGYVFEGLPDWPILSGLDRFCTGTWAARVFVTIANTMGVTVELQNLGDADLSREIVAGIEHALSEKLGEWRVSISGSRAGENWEMRVEGPSGFERSYTLAGGAGEHAPEAIRRLILQLVPTGSL